MSAWCWSLMTKTMAEMCWLAKANLFLLCFCLCCMLPFVFLLLFVLFLLSSSGFSVSSLFPPWFCFFLWFSAYSSPVFFLFPVAHSLCFLALVLCLLRSFFFLRMMLCCSPVFWVFLWVLLQFSPLVFGPKNPMSSSVSWLPSPLLCLCSALPFIEPESMQKPVPLLINPWAGSWCSGLELPDFSLLNRSSPCETKGMVNSGIKTASFGMKKMTDYGLVPFCLKCINWVP